MKKLFLLGISFLMIHEITAQIEFKLTKPISKMDWVKMQDFHRENLINDVEGVVHVEDESGKIWKIFGNRPGDPSDLVSWRPPIVPPLGYEAMDPQSDWTTDMNGEPIPGVNKPNPIDPGCPFCSVIIIHNKLSKSGVLILNKLFSPYIK